MMKIIGNSFNQNMSNGNCDNDHNSNMLMSEI